MKKDFDIQAYMTAGVEDIVKSSLKATLKNPRASAFMVKFAAQVKKANRFREKMEKKGEHIPPFLIASITSTCNLNCKGCYSRCSNQTTDSGLPNQLTADEWGDIFREASEIGISFILLAGGEPMLRRDIIEKAASVRKILFPVFTNGTVFNERYFNLLDEARNIIPVLSLEGRKEKTDSRRGEGVYDALLETMDELKSRSLLYGVSVTVTGENLEEVTSGEFLSKLEEKGCRLVIFVEYVPVDEQSSSLALSDEERERLLDRVDELRLSDSDMVYVSFPGDEKDSDGCIAAGRGFFHINSRGGAEPCPFSPYSDMNVRETSLRQVLKSPLFTALNESDVLKDDHRGGCVLFEKRAEVERLIRENRGS